VVVARAGRELDLAEIAGRTFVVTVSPAHNAARAAALRDEGPALLGLDADRFALRRIGESRERA